MFTNRVRFPWLSGVLFGLLALPAYAFGVRDVSISGPTGDSLTITQPSNIHLTVPEQRISSGQYTLAQGDFSGGSSTPGILGAGPAGSAVYDSGWFGPVTSGTQGGNYQGGNYQSTIIQNSAPTRVDTWNPRSSSAAQVTLAQGDFSGGSSTPGVLGGGPAGVAVYDSGWFGSATSGTQGGNYQGGYQGGYSVVYGPAPVRGSQGGDYTVLYGTAGDVGRYGSFTGYKNSYVGSAYGSYGSYTDYYSSYNGYSDIPGYSLVWQPYSEAYGGVAPGIGAYPYPWGWIPLSHGGWGGSCCFGTRFWSWYLNP